MSGHFFVFDGMDGAGKSTAVAALAAELGAAGYRVLQTREPGGSALAEEIRTCLLSDHAEPMPVETELLLVYAARAAHLQQTILPALARGEIVLCDRFVDSSHVYQGVLGGADPAWIEALSQRTVSRVPELNFIFDLPVEQALARMQRRGQENRFDRAGRQRLETVRQAFRARAALEGRHLVDASRAPDTIVRELRLLIRQRLT